MTAAADLHNGVTGETPTRKLSFDQLKTVEQSVRAINKTLAGVPDRHWPEELYGTLNALLTVSEHAAKLTDLAEAEQRRAVAQATVDFQVEKAEKIREGLREQAKD